MDLNSLLIVALFILLGAALLYIRNGLKQLRLQLERTADKALRADERPAPDPAPVSAPALVDLWVQIEALMTLYRFMDGIEALPTTRGWAASPDILLHLVNHLRINPVHKIIECGSGSSTIVLAYAFKKLNRDGHIWTMESNPAAAKNLEAEIERRGLKRYVTVIAAPLVEKNYDGYDFPFHWYDIDVTRLPNDADLLLIDGPVGKVNELARYPAGPELLPRLAPHAHIFLDDANRPDERRLPQLWRALYPELRARNLRAEKGLIEMFFLTP